MALLPLVVRQELAGSAHLYGGLLIPLSGWFELTPSEDVDRSPSLHWPMPIVATGMEPDRGPVLVTLEYEVDPAHAAAFAQAMNAVARIRRRSGAVSWGLFNDAENPRKWIEVFVDESWVEHLRHHRRVTRADVEVETAARQFLIDGISLIIKHYLAPGR